MNDILPITNMWFDADGTVNLHIKEDADHIESYWFDEDNRDETFNLDIPAQMARFLGIDDETVRGMPGSHAIVTSLDGCVFIGHIEDSSSDYYTIWLVLD